MSFIAARVHHVGLIVTDLERSMAFDNDLFDKEPDILTTVDNSAGLSRQFGVGEEPGDAVAKIAFYHVDNTSVELIQVTKPGDDLVQPPVHQAGAKHLCFQTDDIQAAYDDLVSRGIEFQSTPTWFTQDQPDLDGVKFAYFFDPDGNFLEIMEDPGKAGYIGSEQKAGLPRG
ncbi:VOC family protein [Phycicoccus flavus]|uniref:VOC family protein n=1 Tax=Phycicoccus flavus TaxID=2502783 RepID=A0A8T6R4M1_9MICO|nr:VOC family protein [Phycicoccus flavus]NHA68614.1 VOC family protein [Phycicoccus flavus]NHA68687.1 VOC family protein [Phycicoccus flavus]